MAKSVKKNKRAIVRSLAFLLLLLTVYCVFESNTIEVTKTTYQNSKIPESFNGFKIAQISDLHNREFGKNSEKLLQKIEGEAPDIIVLTGDLVDSRCTNFEKALVFVKGAVQVAPVYYVSGNHESRLDNYWYLKEQLQKLGVTVLDNEKATIEKERKEISVLGLTDPDFYDFESSDTQFQENLQRLQGESGNNFTILLSHRPEKMNVYREAGVDLAFSGHAHGGQIRLPFIGALVAPQQGFLPKYTMGNYKEGDTTLFVSRGLGNSTFVPVRTLNKPEVVVVTLQK